MATVRILFYYLPWSRVGDSKTKSPSNLNEFWIRSYLREEATLGLIILLQQGYMNSITVLLDQTSQDIVFHCLLPRMCTNDVLILVSWFGRISPLILTSYKYGIRNPWGIRSPHKSHQSSDVKEKLVLVALLRIWRQVLQNRTFFRRHAQRSHTVQGIRSGEKLNKCRTPEGTVIISNAWFNWNVDLWQFLSRRFLRPLSGLRFMPLF